MQKEIRQLIEQYVQEYQAKEGIATSWRKPLVAFAAADDELFNELKEIVSPTHLLPQDWQEGAQTVITYFLPFEKSITDSNKGGRYSSQEWVIAYRETNELILQLNKYLKQKLNDLGHQTTIMPATHNFDKERLMSDWSHRHAAYIAGLGKFGINNMLITDQGCSGRVGSIITDLKVPPTQREDKEYCLYKSKGICKQCVQNCNTGALTVDSFDRAKCHELLLANDEFHSEEELSDTCGKCCVGLPCSFTNPVK